MIMLMTVATFIDIDEQTIPDSLTIPGTIAALLIAALCSAPVLPSLFVNVPPTPNDLVTPLRFDFPDVAQSFLQRCDLAGDGAGDITWHGASGYCRGVGDWAWASARHGA